MVLLFTELFSNAYSRKSMSVKFQYFTAIFICLNIEKLRGNSS